MPTGPQSGPQPVVRYCPVCKGDIYSVASNNQDAENSHKYKCATCDRITEINICGREAGKAAHRID